MQTILQMTQDKINTGSRELLLIAADYLEGLITAHELRDQINKVMLPDMMPGIIDPQTGLKYK